MGQHPHCTLLTDATGWQRQNDPVGCRWWKGRVTVGQRAPTEVETTGGAAIARSIRALRSAIAGIGAAAAATSLTSLDAVAKELSKAERLRRRRQRERQEEREEEREQRLAERRRRDNDDDDDGVDDRLELIRARQAAMDRSSDSPRRVTAKQSANDEADAGTAGGGRQVRRQQAASDEASGADEVALRQVNPITSDDETDTGSETAQIRVGSGDTFASIDPETGTATAESNGVRAIAGPDGAFIEGAAVDTPPPLVPDDGADGNDDGDPTDDGGDNGGEPLS